MGKIITLSAFIVCRQWPTYILIIPKYCLTNLKCNTRIMRFCLLHADCGGYWILEFRKMKTSPTLFATIQDGYGDKLSGYLNCNYLYIFFICAIDRETIDSNTLMRRGGLILDAWAQKWHTKYAIIVKYSLYLYQTVRALLVIIKDLVDWFTFEWFCEK